MSSFGLLVASVEKTERRVSLHVLLNQCVLRTSILDVQFCAVVETWTSKQVGMLMCAMIWARHG